MQRQSPIASPFDAFATSRDVLRDIDLTGRTAIVTGGYSGLGLEMTRSLARVGARVIVPVRSLEKAQAALKLAAKREGTVRAEAAEQVQKANLLAKQAEQATKEAWDRARKEVEDERSRLQLRANQLAQDITKEVRARGPVSTNHHPDPNSNPSPSP